MRAISRLSGNKDLERNLESECIEIAQLWSFRSGFSSNCLPQRVGEMIQFDEHGFQMVGIYCSNVDGALELRDFPTEIFTWRKFRIQKPGDVEKIRLNAVGWETSRANSGWKSKNLPFDNPFKVKPIAMMKWHQLRWVFLGGWMFKQIWTTRKRWDKKGVPNPLGMPGPLILFPSIPGISRLKKSGTFMELPFITKAFVVQSHVQTIVKQLFQNQILETHPFLHLRFHHKEKPWNIGTSPAEMRFWGSRLWTESRQWVGNLSTSTRYSFCIRSEMVGIKKILRYFV